MKRMLINGTQQEELRVALVDGQLLRDLDIETPSKEQKKSNIYKAKVTRVEPSLEAVFVDYGSERHGFLPAKEIAKHYCAPGSIDDRGRIDLKKAIKSGQEIVVQVEKEERGNKGAALTTKISLAGRYLVLMPTDGRAGGVSRRINSEDRAEIREALSQIDIPNDMGVIVRTAGVGRSAEELQWDFEYLQQLWGVISEASEQRAAPFLIYQESNVIIRALRDHYRADIGEILIDEESIFQQAQNFMNQVMPNDTRKLKLYEDKIPLFNRFQIESQIESAFNREVTLPSGGSIVIDHTEALTAIDINSARATKGGDIEETATNTNLEAADEIARQLRIRDLGGLVVIDFIDMNANKHQREVENRVRDALQIDRARVQVGRISQFGLLEMSRQRLRPSLGESSEMVCPRCSGHGTIRGVESLALSVLRIVEEEAMKENTAKVKVQVPTSVATFLMNEKRDSINAVQSRNAIDIVLIPNKDMETPHYTIDRVRMNDDNDTDTAPSYELATPAAEQATQSSTETKTSVTKEQPAVKNITPAARAPKPKAKGPGIIRRILIALFGDGSTKPAPKKNNNRNNNNNRNRNRSNNNNRNRNNNNNRNRNNNNANRNNPNNPNHQNRNKQNKQGNQNKDNANKENGETVDNKNTNTENTQDNKSTNNRKPRNNSTRNRNRNPNNRNANNKGKENQTGENKAVENKDAPQKSVDHEKNGNLKQPVEETKKVADDIGNKTPEAKPAAKKATRKKAVKKASPEKGSDKGTDKAADKSAAKPEKASAEKSAEKVAKAEKPAKENQAEKTAPKAKSETAKPKAKPKAKASEAKADKPDSKPDSKPAAKTAKKDDAKPAEKKADEKPPVRGWSSS